MTTQIIDAQQGLITNEVSETAVLEKLNENFIMESVGSGETVVLKNNTRQNSTPVTIGKNLTTKVCCDFDISSPIQEFQDRLKIIKMADCDILFENGVVDNCDEKREKILSLTTLPYGVNPIFQAVRECINKDKAINKLNKKKILETIEKQCKQGVDYLVITAGFTKELLETIDNDKRIGELSSDIGAFLYCYMKSTDKENPLYECFDEVLDIARTYDVTLVLSSALASVSVFDFMDNAYIKEIINIGKLIKKARESGVQTAFEGIGCGKINEIEQAIKFIKKKINYAPIFTLNSSVTMADGNCSLASNTIASSLMATYGADLISVSKTLKNSACFNAKQIKENIISAKISAHSADIAKGIKIAEEKEKQITISIRNKHYNTEHEEDLEKTLFSDIPLEILEKPCSACAKNCASKKFENISM